MAVLPDPKDRLPFTLPLPFDQRLNIANDLQLRIELVTNDEVTDARYDRVCVGIVRRHAKWRKSGL